MAKNDSKTVMVGCRLPHGIVLEHPLDPSNKVTLNGLNKIIIIGQTYGQTRVDADFMQEWEAVNREFPAYKSGAIFIAKDEIDVVAKAAELEKAKTGFEPMQTDGKDERARGVKSANEKD